MRISSMSMASLAVNGVVGAFNAYANPSRWIAGFVVGLLAGIYTGKKAYTGATQGSTSRKSRHVESPISQRDGKDILLRAMPGAPTTILNLFALQMRRMAADTRLQRYSGDLAAASLGYACGQLLYLNKLNQSQDLQIAKQMKRAVV